MDPVARKKLNLEVLKRHDANICDILDQSPHCVVYKFDIQKNSWEKLGYEGVIFLTQGKAAPYFSLYVLNRLSIENFSLHLTDFEEIDLNAEFIIYQTSEGEACALWLYEQKDRERIVAKIHQLHEGMKAIPFIQHPQKQNNTPAATNNAPVNATTATTITTTATATAEQPKVDILQMLKKASTNSSSPLENTSRDLMGVLNGSQLAQLKIKEQQKQHPHQQQQQQQQLLYQQQQQQQPIPMPQPFQSPYQPMPPLPIPPMPMHMNPPPIQCDNFHPFPMPTAENNDNKNNNNHENRMRMGDINNSNGSDMSRRIISNGELTKPFYPPYMSMSPAASPRNPGALLQALHGGVLPMPPHPHGMPMMHTQQVGDVMLPDLSRRFEKGPLLSKPEFIQQVLNIIQCEPSFFDVLYENYKRQATPLKQQQ